MKTLHSVLFALVVIVAQGTPAFGVITSSEVVVSGNDATFTAPPSLIQGITAAYVGGNSPVAVGTFAGWPQMNDGIVGTALGSDSQVLLLDHATSSFVPAYAVWILDTSVNTNGYDIFSIQSFAGFNANRPWQNIEIKYALVGETITGELTHSLGSFVYQPGGLSGYNASRLTIEDNFGEAILTGVSAIQVTYLDNGAGEGASENFTSYRELSVVGVASVPEPATVALFGIAAAGVLLRWRMRK